MPPTTSNIHSQEDQLIGQCLLHIEKNLGWGPSEKWTTLDYERLSEKIRQSTGVNLSVATLKRVWGKVRYESRPNATTLDTLARFAGFESWRNYCLLHGGSENGNGASYRLNGSGETTTSPSAASKARWVKWIPLIVIVSGLLAGGWYLYFRPAVPDPSRFSFSSRTVVDAGVPNSVIFDYDASAAGEDDTVMIQQSWDKRLSTRVSRLDRQHTSIYYYPGYFEAKLVINQKIMKEHILLIKTDGWLPLIEQKGTPVYLKESDVMHDGMMGLTTGQIEAHHIHLQPETPWVDYYNIREFDSLRSDDFVFVTEVRNDFGEGSGACRFTYVRLQFEGPAIVIPLTAPGCVSDIDFGNQEGKKTDLSAFGVDLSTWVKVECIVKGVDGEVLVNGRSAIKFKRKQSPARFLGVGYRFQGTGSVRMMQVGTNDGKVEYGLGLKVED